MLQKAQQLQATWRGKYHVEINQTHDGHHNKIVHEQRNNNRYRDIDSKAHRKIVRARQQQRYDCYHNRRHDANVNKRR